MSEICVVDRTLPEREIPCQRALGYVIPHPARSLGDRLDHASRGDVWEVFEARVLSQRSQAVQESERLWKPPIHTTQYATPSN